MNRKITTGRFGENLAVKYLIAKQYLIISRNIKVSCKEIDVIAKLNGITVFLEVKTRTSNKLGQAEDAMYGNKLKNFKNGVISYCNKYNIDMNTVRLDLIAININKQNKIANIKHYKAVA